MVSHAALPDRNSHVPSVAAWLAKVSACVLLVFNSTARLGGMLATQLPAIAMNAAVL